MELVQVRSRRKARECALQALYRCDLLSDWSRECWSHYFTHFVDSTVSGAEKDNLMFCRDLVAGVFDHIQVVDALLTTASHRWQLDRMSVVDRNILRLAVFEISFLEDVPSNVSINEGIELAKRFGADDSANFVNGVLDRCFKIVTETDFLSDFAAKEQAVHLQPKVVNG